MIKLECEVYELKEIAQAMVPPPPIQAMPDVDTLARTICSELHRYGAIVSAIKLLRTCTGLGLKEAKDKVDWWWSSFDNA